MTKAFLVGVSLAIVTARPFTWILVDESTPYDFSEGATIYLGAPNHPWTWNNTIFHMTRTVTGSTNSGPSWASWVTSIQDSSYDETILAGSMSPRSGYVPAALVSYANNYGWQKWGDNSSSPPVYVQRWRNWWSNFSYYTDYIPD